MTIVSEPEKYQCALFKSSRKHYVNAIEAFQESRNLSGHLTAARETAEAGNDTELEGWLNTLLAGYEAGGNMDATIAGLVCTRYNQYNAICGWGVDDLDPDNPFILPGDDGMIEV